MEVRKYCVAFIVGLIGMSYRYHYMNNPDNQDLLNDQFPDNKTDIVDSADSIMFFEDLNGEQKSNNSYILTITTSIVGEKKDVSFNGLGVYKGYNLYLMRGGATPVRDIVTFCKRKIFKNNGLFGIERALPNGVIVKVFSGTMDSNGIKNGDALNVTLIK